MLCLDNYHYYYKTCRDCVASVVEIESESTSTTLATQSRHVHDHMETRLKNTVRAQRRVHVLHGLALAAVKLSQHA